MKKKILIYIIVPVALLSCDRQTKQTASAQDATTISSDEKYAQEVNKGILADTTKKSVPRKTSAL